MCNEERLLRKKVFIKTFGCQMNVHDSDKLVVLLENEYCSVDSADEADLILVNTCSVREKPEHKLYSILGEFRGLKEKKPGILIGVGGCVAQQEGEKIVRRSSVVDFVFGTHNLSLVPSLITLRKQGAPPQVAVDYRDEWEELPLGFGESTRVSTFVSISRGCNKRCTYCIVPRTRGREVSRKMDEIKREVRMAVHRGAREIVLLGQTVNSYGRDLHPRLSFVDLLGEVCAISGVERVRFTSPHPQEVREELISFIAAEPKICRHIHLPLQSGSDRILKSMNRNYRRERYLEIVDSLMSKMPDLAITTDVIVGFPGESEDDFRQTLEVLERVRFYSSYSFMFSARPGTPAAEMVGQVEPEVRLARLQLFQARQEEITTQQLEYWVGRQAEVLLEGEDRSELAGLRGRTSQNVTVNFLENRGNYASGQSVMARIKRAARHTLQGEVVD